MHAEQGEEGKAKQAYGKAAKIVHSLAKTIDEEDLRAGYVAAAPVQAVLEKSEGSKKTIHNFAVLPRHPLPTKLLGEHMILWRSRDAVPYALRNPCIHRDAALSLGW